MGDPFWEPPLNRGFGRPPGVVDVLIVGGGITGASLLWHLRGRGLRVALVERAAHLAASASGRNAGFLLAGVSSCYAVAARVFGRDVARDAWAFTRESHARMGEALAGRADLRRRGSVTLAASPEEAEDLMRSVDMMREDGIDAWWDATLGPPVHSHGGVLVAEDGELDPAAAVGALAGDEDVYLNVEATRLLEGPRVETCAGEIRAETIVLAVNAHVRHLVPALPVVPVRAQMLATDAADPVCSRPVYADRGFQYWRQLDSGHILAGGYRDRAVDEEVGEGLDVTDRVQQHLDRHLKMLCPAARISHRWAGTMGFSPDGLPLAGPVPQIPGAHFIGGYTGHGMGFAFNLARIYVDNLFGSARVPEWLRLERAL